MNYILWYVFDIVRSLVYVKTDTSLLKYVHVYIIYRLMINIIIHTYRIPCEWYVSVSETCIPYTNINDFYKYSIFTIKSDLNHINF